MGGPTLVIGSGTADLGTRGDLVLTGAGDPTREKQQDFRFGGAGPSVTQQQSWFSLWQPGSAIGLFSAGGNLVPILDGPLNTQTAGALPTNGNATATDYRYIYPPILEATAASGAIYLLGQVPQASVGSPVVALETAPSPLGTIQMLAGTAIYADAPIAVTQTPGGTGALSYQGFSGRVAVDISGADPTSLPNPLAPAYNRVGLGGASTNVSPNGHSGALALFAFEPDTASPDLHLGDPSAALFYAAKGDIVNLQVGEVITFPSSAQETPPVWYIGGKAVRVVAGGDVVLSGSDPLYSNTSGQTGSLSLLAPDLTGNAVRNGATADVFVSGNLIVDANGSDVSEITAGRDILYLNADVAGPGRLVVQAGRDLYQADQGVIESLGLVNRSSASSSGGAGITVVAGTGAAGPAYAAFADLYASAANLADPVVPLQDQPGRVPSTYQAQLLAFLQQDYGYGGTAAGALAFFATLPTVEQARFVLPVYYGELNQAGLNYNDPASRFYKSYLTGNLAIASLFPRYASTGYSGAVTLFGGSGIRTDYGGDIQMLVPGGGITLGVEAAAAPPASSGVVTQGNGNIDIFAQGSVLLGQSRILTTFGGSILIWSRGGDINAGRGSKGTVLSTPVGIVYDPYGDVSLSPTVPSSGAGIGTLAPIPSVTAGDVNLIAPQGTIDAGEAGIRSSGNANLAALAVVNAANIQVKGSTAGTPVIAVPNIGALAAASAVAGSQQVAGQQAGQAQQRRQSDSIITVEVLGFGP